MKRPGTVSEAIADLAALRSSDPAARHAMQAIRLTRLTLESFWIDSPNAHAADESAAPACDSAGDDAIDRNPGG